MIKTADIAKCILDFCPASLCFEGDNVGHLIGDPDSEVKNVLVTLDVDEKVVDEAIEKGVDLIVSHHPVMFRPVSSLVTTTPQKRAIIKMLRHGISLISAHTNLDSVSGGLNDLLASKLGLTDTCVIEQNGTYCGAPYGFGRAGQLKNDKTLADMLSLCKTTLGANGMKYIGSLDNIAKKVAVNCGSGADVIPWCIENNIDLLITGDVKYSYAREAYEAGLMVIDAGHYETEHIVVELLSSIIEKSFNGLCIKKSEANIPVFKYYTE